MRKWIVVLMLPLILSITLAYIDQPETAPTANQCYNIKSLGLTSDGYSLDADKVIALTYFDYDCAKNILGLWDYDFFIAITDIGGGYEEIENLYVAYGLWPGKTISNVIYQVDSDIGVAQIPPYQGISGFAVAPPPTVTSSTDLIAKTTPDPYGFDNARTFSRLMLLKVDGTYKLVKITLGVWK